MLSLGSVNDIPSDISVPGEEEVWTQSADERRKHLLCFFAGGFMTNMLTLNK